MDSIISSVVRVPARASMKISGSRKLIKKAISFYRFFRWSFTSCGIFLPQGSSVRQSLDLNFEEIAQRLIHLIRLLQHHEMPRIELLHLESRCERTGRALCTIRRTNWILSCGEQKNWLGQVLCGYGDYCEYTVNIGYAFKECRFTILILDIQVAVQGSIMVESRIVAASICCEDASMDCLLLLVL